MFHITKKCGTNRIYSKPNRSIEWIVIHYTAGMTSRAGSAKNTAAFFASASAGGSADFIVDDEEVVQYNPDIHNYYCAAVGGKQYSVKTTSLSSSLYETAKNSNCVSIEICSSKRNRQSMAVTDDDWYFTDEVLERAAEFTAYLMNELDLPIEHVIMHHHVNGKYCPQPWTMHEYDLGGWRAFLDKVEGYAMTGEQIYKKLNEYLADQPVPEWAKKEYQEAIQAGITDGSSPCQLVPRYQAAIMIKRGLKGK